MSDSFVDAISRIAEVRENEPMSRHTTFGVGGTADIFAVVTSEDQLKDVFTLAKSRGVPVLVFGSGSNVLVSDSGIRGLIIDNQNTEISGPTQNGTGFKVRAGSGMAFATLARRLASAGYAGIEWACGIPGSLGGAVVTNAGAYGHALSDVLITARVADSGGRSRELDAGGLRLTYRGSALLDDTITDAIVLSVELRVQKGDAGALKATIREFDARRKQAQPPGRNCGSVFKNPGDRPAWQYVDDAGLRGHRIGNAQFSEQHSNFILNLGGATANDVASLIRLARDRVRSRLGVELETEVMFVGDFRDAAGEQS